MMSNGFNLKQYVFVTLVVSIWVHMSEVFRYFIIVIPRVKSYWNNLEYVADMNWRIFSIWGLWDTILTAMIVFLFWLYSRVFGNNIRSVIFSGILLFVFFFVLYWVGAANMGYSSWSILSVTLPLCLFEMIVASFIASKLYKKYDCEKV